jgi:hypothetical protein
MPWYDYTAIQPGHPKPYLEVRLWHGNRSVRLLALVDSGADKTLIDAQYLPLLGLDPATATTAPAVGAGGTDIDTFEFPGAPIEIQFENRRIPFAGLFIDFSAGADPMNLLGRSDFFSQHIIQFWDSAQIFNIDQSPDYSQNPPAH